MSEDAVTQILAELAELKARLGSPRDRLRLHDARSAARHLVFSVALFSRAAARCPTLLARAGAEGTPLHVRWLEGQLDDYVVARGDEAAAAAAITAFRNRNPRRSTP